jgi:hypothetical protein
LQALPFEDSRRLMGANLFFASPGAVLDVGVPLDDDLLMGWRARVERAGARLGWLKVQTIARRYRGGASLALAAPADQLLLGHAGNRTDADIAEVVRVAVGSRPDLVVVKENETQLRGRAPGEVPGIIRAELQRLGFPDVGTRMASSELDAARDALDWAHSGDVLALPIHSASARTAVIALLKSEGKA